MTMINQTVGPSCPLYTVMRTNLHTYERERMECVPSDFQTTSERARWYQRIFDPDYEFYDFRLGSCH